MSSSGPRSDTGAGVDRKAAQQHRAKWSWRFSRVVRRRSNRNGKIHRCGRSGRCAQSASLECHYGPSDERCEAKSAGRPADDRPSVLLYIHWPEPAVRCLLFEPAADRSRPPLGCGRRPGSVGVHVKGRRIPAATVPGHDDGPVLLVDAFDGLSAQQRDRTMATMASLSPRPSMRAVAPAQLRPRSPAARALQKVRSTALIGADMTKTREAASAKTNSHQLCWCARVRRRRLRLSCWASHVLRLRPVGRDIDRSRTHRGLSRDS